jgi:hypothetical protein
MFDKKLKAEAYEVLTTYHKLSIFIDPIRPEKKYFLRVRQDEKGHGKNVTNINYGQKLISDSYSSIVIYQKYVNDVF